MTEPAARPHRTALSTMNSPADRQVDHQRVEAAVREILIAVGEDPDREGLQETPARVARMYAELFSGLHEDPRVHLRKFFSEQYDEVVLAVSYTHLTLPTIYSV